MTSQAGCRVQPQVQGVKDPWPPVELERQMVSFSEPSLQTSGTWNLGEDRVLPFSATSLWFTVTTCFVNQG